MDKKLLKSILFIITYAVVLVVVLARLDVIGHAVMWVLGVLQPLLIGFAIAFVLNRPCRFFHRLYLRGLGSTRARKAARPLAVLSSYLALIAVITAIFAYVLPKFVESIQTFVLNLSGYLTNLQSGYNQLIDQLNLDAESLDLSWLGEKLSGLLDQVLAFLSDTGPQLLASVTSSLVSAVVTGVLAVVFSIYMLSGQEKLLRHRGLHHRRPDRRGDALHPGGLRPPHRRDRGRVRHHPGGGGLYRRHCLRPAAAGGLPRQGSDLPDLPHHPPAV